MTKRPPRKIIIAIDGPAGSGKSTTAREVAKRLKLPFIDTGAMYRAVTLKIMQKKIPFSDKKRMIQVAKKIRIRFVRAPLAGARWAGTSPARTEQRVYVDGQDVTQAIREPKLTANVVHIANEPLIRREMVRLQRAMGKKGGAVMEGRDIGTVVFPKADFKFYFDSDPRLRARRRWKELKAEGKKVSINHVLQEIHRRDRSDRSREEGALRRAKDAIVVDTTPLTIAQTADRICAIVGAAG